MFAQDIPFVILWWAILFVIGSAAYPLTRRFFSSWWDSGYLLSKAVGLASVTYIVWFLGSWHILPFRVATIGFATAAVFGIGLAMHYWKKEKLGVVEWKKILALELFFFVCLVTWSYVKAHEPHIRGLEKFMDYGFSQSIINSDYFPAHDMWFAGGSINYYYFGHTMQALLATFSGIDLAYGYNLMLSTIFALCFTMSFSIGAQLWVVGCRVTKQNINWGVVLITGFLAAFLVTLAGNMQTIYAFTKGYSGEQTPPPFWDIAWSMNEFPSKVSEGFKTYWYANATRFIPFTIHEFPSYSFVVSDNHGHVLSIPFALLAIAGLGTLFVGATAHGQRGKGKGERGKGQGERGKGEGEGNKDIPLISHLSSLISKDNKRKAIEHILSDAGPYMLYGFLAAILFMTNALDGPIYLGLFTILLFSQSVKGFLHSFSYVKDRIIILFMVLASFLFAAMPFLLSFKSFATGVALNCPPAALANSHIGPLIFEGVEKCQRSPLWMMFLLWGFFWFCGVTLLVKSTQYIVHSRKLSITFTPITRFLAIIFVYTIALILFAEVFYFKDIYPAHFRSNTMFKLGYQAFMMGGLFSAFVIVSMIAHRPKHMLAKVLRRIFFLAVTPMFFLVAIYPYFSVRSYFGELKTYRGLYGLSWFSSEYPDDYKIMQWLKKTVAKERRFDIPSGSDHRLTKSFFNSHLTEIPVILEADGDSYTDYNRMSAFAGLPTVIGWGVHEWLWRGTYDVVSPRRDDVLKIYESQDLEEARRLLKKYNVSYVVVGKIERDKFKALQEQTFERLGHEVYRWGDSAVWALDKLN